MKKKEKILDIENRDDTKFQINQYVTLKNINF